MKRLINPDELKSDILSKMYLAQKEYLHKSHIVHQIDIAPTVDAVEVVRCKDCKHMEMTPDDLRWCNVWSGINGMGDEGFCNYGERKNDDGLF